VVEILLVTLQSGLKSTFNKLQALKKKWMPQPTISTSTSPKPQASTLPITHLPTNPNTIILITPKLRITILSPPTQHKVPIIQLSSRNTRPLRKSYTVPARVGHEVFIAICRDATLRRSWCCYLCTRGFLRGWRGGRWRGGGNANAVVFLAPELGGAVLARGAEDGVPGVELGEGDAGARGEGWAGAAGVGFEVGGAGGYDA
jgi:hypothetical protein